MLIAAKDYYINEEIRAREVRLIDSKGAQLGILPIEEALGKAREAGLDLILIAPSAKPPVCKIEDYGKMRYEQMRKEKEARKASKVGTLKETKLTPKIGEHDLNVRIRRTLEFLEKNYKVKVTMSFRGREITHKEIGFNVINKFIEGIKEKGAPEGPPKSMGKTIILMIAPSKTKPSKSAEPAERS